MRVLVSSKNLSRALSEIDFKTDSVYNVTLENSELSINTQIKSVRVYVHVVLFKAAVKQENRRWDWIKDIVSSADEQPIALDIHENCTNVIFQY